jgi:hypothetical protein
VPRGGAGLIAGSPVSWPRGRFRGRGVVFVIGATAHDGGRRRVRPGVIVRWSSGVCEARQLGARGRQYTYVVTMHRRFTHWEYNYIFPLHGYIKIRSGRAVVLALYFSSPSSTRGSGFSRFSLAAFLVTLHAGRKTPKHKQKCLGN